MHHLASVLRMQHSVQSHQVRQDGLPCVLVLCVKETRAFELGTSETVPPDSSSDISSANTGNPLWVVVRMTCRMRETDSMVLSWWAEESTSRGDAKLVQRRHSDQSVHAHVDSPQTTSLVGLQARAGKSIIV